MAVEIQSHNAFNQTIFSQSHITIFDKPKESAHRYIETRTSEPPKPQPKPAKPDFSRFKHSEHARLESFNDQWPTGCPVTKQDLAAAGLFFTGPVDRVQCPWCEGGLHNWERGDSAFGEHARHFPSCPFVVERLWKSTKPADNHSSNSHMDETTETNTGVEAAGPQLKDWTQLACVIAIIGLGYSTDEVEMAVTSLTRKGVSASSLTTDMIMDEIFAIDHSAMQEQKELPSETHETNIEDQQESNTTCTNTTSEQLGEIHVEITRLKQENEQLKSNMTCKICLDARVGELFLPCRHLVCCTECAAAVKACPLCREHIVGTIKTFL